MSRLSPACLLLVVSGLLSVAPAVTAAAAAGPPAAMAARAAVPGTGRLEFGAANGPDQLAWMTSSGTPWRYRYQYLAGGVNTPNSWQTWQDPSLPRGQFAVDYMNNSHAAGIIPVFTYYELLQSTPSTGPDERSRDMSNLQNTATMAAYYNDFKLLMQRAGAFSPNPVVVHVEPDFWGYAQATAEMAGHTTPDTVPASVASSGVAENAGLPDTVQGFGWALLHLRDLYAPNAALAIHASSWNSNSNTYSGFDVAADAARVAAFLAPAGVTTTYPGGSSWDLVFNDVDDHDAGWWEAQGQPGRWWDATNSRLPDFAQWLTFISHLHADLGKPVVVWQVPEGNQHFLTMNNTCGHYQDNVAEYFMGHTADLWSAGLVAVLFGAGNPCQTTTYDGRNDGVTNNNGVPTTDTAGGCNACNTATSTVADDDGGYIRQSVAAYYAGAPTRRGGAFHPLAPTRVLDTRTSTGGHPSPLGPAGQMDLQVGGAGGIPAVGAAAVVLSVAATNTSAASFLTLWPAGAARPNAAALNWAAGQTVPNLVTVPVSATGSVSIWNASGSADVVADAAGWYDNGGTGPDGLYNPLAPFRAVDTRPATQVGPRTGPLGPGQQFDLAVPGVPAGAEAVVLNVAVTNTTAPSFLRVFPAGTPMPNASNLNWVPGQTVPDRVVVKLGAAGAVTIYNLAGDADVVVDVGGWYTGAGGGGGALFTAAGPARILDTRPAFGQVGPYSTPQGPGTVRAVQVGGLAGAPAAPAALVANVAVTGTTADGYLAAYPSGSPPAASDLNWAAGQTVSNAVAVKVAPDGSIRLFNPSGSTDVVIDLVGWFS